MKAKNKKMDSKKIFINALKKEANALLEYKEEYLDDLEDIISIILESKGKIIISGVGKSGLIARKISATLSSTGTPSIFLHPTEGMHGDLGILQKDDIFIAISYSGETSELLEILPHVKRLGLKCISLSKSKDSKLSSSCEYFLPLKIHFEACPINTAPTTSTTLTLALGDALAICLMEKRGFKEDNFASFHPGGNLGLNLFVKAFDLANKKDLPILNQDASLKECIDVMTKARLGCALFLEDGKLEGMISDGDLRRAMISKDFSLENPALRYASKDVKTISKDLLAKDALKIIKDYKIQALAITNKDNKLEGILHLHALIDAGFKIKE